MNKLVAIVIMAVVVGASVGIVFSMQQASSVNSEKDEPMFSLLDVYYTSKDVAPLEKITIDDYHEIYEYRPRDFYIWQNDNWVLVQNCNVTTAVTIVFESNETINCRWIIEYQPKWAYYDKYDNIYMEKPTSRYKEIVVEPNLNQMTFELSLPVLSDVTVTAMDLSLREVLFQETVSLSLH